MCGICGCGGADETHPHEHVHGGDPLHEHVHPHGDDHSHEHEHAQAHEHHEHDRAHGEPCPSCGGSQWVLVSGNEMRVVDLEVE